MNSIKNKKNNSKKIVIAVGTLLVIGITAIVIAKLPIIRNLITEKIGDNNIKYQDYKKAIGKTKSDKGIDITLESAIGDNSTLKLSFLVKNNNKSIKDDFTDATQILCSFEVNGKDVSSFGPINYELIDENTGRIQQSIRWESDDLTDKLNVDLQIEKMFEKSGNWDIRFALDITQINKDTYVEKLDKIINANGIDFNITKLVMTPLTTRMEYYQTGVSEDSKEVSFIISDGEGNEVKKNVIEGHSNMDLERYESSIYYISNPNAKILDIVPYYPKYENGYEVNYEGKLPPTEINIENFTPINLKINEDISIDINDCIVDGEFLIIKYSPKYLNKIITSSRLSNLYVEIEGEELPTEKDQSLEYTKKMVELGKKYKNHDNNIEVVKIGNFKNIEIGAYDGTSKVYLKDQAFTVTKE